MVGWLKGPIALYRAPQIGSGTIEDPFRSILNELIDTSAGEWFDEIDHESVKDAAEVRRLESVCCVRAAQKTHDRIRRDPRVTLIGEVKPETDPMATSGLMARQALRQAAQTVLRVQK
jgi:hypothetical protein